MPCICLGCRAFVLPCCNTAPYKRLQLVLCCKCNYTAHAAKRITGLYRGFSCDLPHFTAANTRPTQAAIIPPAPRRSVSQRPDDLQRIQDTTATLDAVQLSVAVYYNKVYKSAGVRPCYRSMPDSAAYHRPCQPGGVSILPTPGGLQSGTGSVVKAHRVSLAPSARRGSPAAGHGGRRGTIDGYRRSSFRAFAR